MQIVLKSVGSVLKIFSYVLAAASLQEANRMASADIRTVVDSRFKGAVFGWGDRREAAVGWLQGSGV